MSRIVLLIPLANIRIRGVCRTLHRKPERFFRCHGSVGYIRRSLWCTSVFVNTIRCNGIKADIVFGCCANVRIATNAHEHRCCFRLGIVAGKRDHTIHGVVCLTVDVDAANAATA